MRLVLLALGLALGLAPRAPGPARPATGGIEHATGGEVHAVRRPASEPGLMAGAGEALEATGLRERGPVPDDGDLSAAALRAPRHTGAGAYRPRRSSLPPPRLSGLSAGLFLPHRSTAPPGRG